MFQLRSDWTVTFQSTNQEFQYFFCLFVFNKENVSIKKKPLLNCFLCRIKHLNFFYFISNEVMIVISQIII